MLIEGIFCMKSSETTVEFVIQLLPTVVKNLLHKYARLLFPLHLEMKMSMVKRHYLTSEELTKNLSHARGRPTSIKGFK